MQEYQAETNERGRASRYEVGITRNKQTKRPGKRRGEERREDVGDREEGQQEVVKGCQ